MIYFDIIIYVSILVCYVTAVCRVVKLSYIPLSRRVGRQCITQIYRLCRIYYCYYCVIAVVRQLGTVFRSFSSSLTRYYYFIFSIPFVGWHGLPFQENIYCTHFQPLNNRTNNNSTFRKVRRQKNSSSPSSLPLVV